MIRLKNWLQTTVLSSASILCLFSASLLASDFASFDSDGYYTARQPDDCREEGCGIEFFGANNKLEFWHTGGPLTECVDGSFQSTCFTANVNYDAIGGYPFADAIVQYRNPRLLLKGEIVDGTFVVEQALERVGDARYGNVRGELYGLTKEDGAFKTELLNDGAIVAAAVDDLNPYLVPRGGIYQTLVTNAINEGSTVIVRGRLFDQRFSNLKELYLNEIYLEVGAMSRIDPALCPSPYVYDGKSCTIYDARLDFSCEFPLVPKESSFSSGLPGNKFLTCLAP